MWKPENEGLCTKMAVLQKQFAQTFVKTLQIKAKSLSVIALDLPCSDSLCGFLGEWASKKYLWSLLTWSVYLLE